MNINNIKIRNSIINDIEKILLIGFCIPPTYIMFNKGDTIRHNSFGRGIIKDINYKNSSYIIKFEEKDTERNISW